MNNSMEASVAMKFEVVDKHKEGRKKSLFSKILCGIYLNN